MASSFGAEKGCLGEASGREAGNVNARCGTVARAVRRCRHDGAVLLAALAAGLEEVPQGAEAALRLVAAGHLTFAAVTAVAAIAVTAAVATVATLPAVAA